MEVLTNTFRTVISDRQVK
ncbi:hypothetical protein [Citrobacter arsenatis]